MITSRLALIALRLLLVGIGLFYGILKVVEPKASPLIFATRGQFGSLGTPFSTNRSFALTLIAISTVLSIWLITLTVRNLRRDLKLFKQPSPFSSPTEIALLSLFALCGWYYFVLNVLVGTQWFYSGTLALLVTVLAVYEGRQYAK